MNFAIADKDQISHEYKSFEFADVARKELTVGIKIGNMYYSMQGKSFSVDNVKAFVAGNIYICVFL